MRKRYRGSKEGEREREREKERGGTMIREKRMGK